LSALSRHALEPGEQAHELDTAGGARLPIRARCAARRTLALPARCVRAPVQHRAQDIERQPASWTEQGLVFASRAGTKPDAHNVRREFRAVLTTVDGLDPAEWTPRELRHSFVSLLSDSGIPIEEISRLVGHRSTTATDQVNRHQFGR
jgi:integrase